MRIKGEKKMAKLNKNLTLYDRDEDGKLIPQEVPLDMSDLDMKRYPEYVDTTINIIPMTRGALKKVFGIDGKDTDSKPDTDKDGDAEIIVKYCKEPVYTLDELKYAKPVIVRSLVRTIFGESGVKFDDAAGTKQIDDNDEFGKN